MQNRKSNIIKAKKWESANSYVWCDCFYDTLEKAKATETKQVKLSDAWGQGVSLQRSMVECSGELWMFHIVSVMPVTCLYTLLKTHRTVHWTGLTLFFFTHTSRSWSSALKEFFCLISPILFSLGNKTGLGGWNFWRGWSRKANEKKKLLREIFILLSGSWSWVTHS